MRYLGQIHLAQKLGKLTVNIRKLTKLLRPFLLTRNFFLNLKYTLSIIS
jgi:hypothetical protein